MAEEHDGTRQVHGEVEDSGLGGCGLAAELRCCQEHAADEDCPDGVSDKTGWAELLERCHGQEHDDEERDEHGREVMTVTGLRHLPPEVVVSSRGVGFGCVVGERWWEG